MRRLVSLAAAAVLATGLLTACSDDPAGEEPDDTVTAEPTTRSPQPEESDTAAEDEEEAPAGRRQGPPRVVKTIATGLAAPWGIAFLPNGDAVVTERDTTRVLVLRAPAYSPRQVGTISAAQGLGGQGGEAGLLGVAVSPDFAEDRNLYFYASTGEDNRILRARLQGGRLGPTTPILTGIPWGFTHDGGRLAFGPDGYLYASTGEAGDRELAQDRGSLGGKILRITTDGDPAPGNPDPNSPIWTWGHRNVQGLAFDDDGRLWASEFGDQTYDELNLIRKGGNYGWPQVEGRGDADGMTNPQVVWSTDTASPSGLAYLDGRLWLASLRGQRLWRVDVDGGKAGNAKDFLVGEYGRMRTVVATPEGQLWLSTSNRDGRGDPRRGDDRILLIDP